MWEYGLLIDEFTYKAYLVKAMAEGFKNLKKSMTYFINGS